MTPKNELHAYRLQMEATQQTMADAMGLPIRTYEDLENGRTQLRDVHMNAAAYACIKIMGAVGWHDMKLPRDVRDCLAKADLV